MAPAVRYARTVGKSAIGDSANGPWGIPLDGPWGPGTAGEDGSGRREGADRAALPSRLGRRLGFPGLRVYLDELPIRGAAVAAHHGVIPVEPQPARPLTGDLAPGRVEPVVHLHEPSHHARIIGADREGLEQRDRRLLPATQVAEDRRDVDVARRGVGVQA